MFGVSNLPSDSDHVGLCFRQFRSGADATVRAPVSLFLTTPTCSLRDRPLTLVHRSRGRAKRGVIRSQSPGLNRYHYGCGSTSTTAMDGGRAGVGSTVETRHTQDNSIRFSPHQPSVWRGHAANTTRASCGCVRGCSSVRVDQRRTTDTQRQR